MLTMTKPLKLTRRRRPPDPTIQARNEDIIRARMFGASLRKIARAYGLSLSHVQRITAGVLVIITTPKRPRKSRKRPERQQCYFELRQQAYTLRKRGFSYRQIAKAVGCSHGFAHLVAKPVKITKLEGNAWLSREGRPKAWVKSVNEQNITTPLYTPRD